MAVLKYIVTGTGRCGTVFFAKLLTSIGINCGHETIFSYEGLQEAKRRLNQGGPLKVSLISELASGTKEKWFTDGIDNIQADSSYMAAPFLADESFQEAKIIHLVRHPLEVINSFVYGLNYFRNNCLEHPDFRDYHNFIYEHVPVVLDYVNFIDRAAMYYIEWNKLIENNSKDRPYIRHNIKRSLHNVFKFIGIPEPVCYYDNTKSNHIRGLNRIITDFKHIPSLEVRNKLLELYRRYFYISM